MPKSGIHPNYRPATITCGCGTIYDTFSTKGSFHVEICAACHPFFTGKQKLLDTAGRVERFQRKYGRTGIQTAGSAPADKPGAATPKS